ncbi:MAG: SDR family NAD(P)-dependent oxidoreductase [Candidatus Omnitrophota bacterium]
MLKNKKILVTGATGFIGSNLAAAFLEKEARVFIFTRPTSDRWRLKGILKRVSDHSVDLTDRAGLNKTVALIGPDIIVHNAVYGGFLSQDDAEKTHRINYHGTVNLLNACVKTGFEVFINTGTSSEYKIQNRALGEADALEETGAYGSSRARAALFCQREAAARGQGAIVTLRLFSPYGYYDAGERLIPSVIMSCLKGKRPKVSSPGPVRDFIFIEDIIDAYVKTIENAASVSGEIFNIGCGRQRSVLEVVKQILEITGSSAEPEWGSMRNPRTEPVVWQADISKAQRLLKWRPAHSLEQGLTKTVDWFRENLSLYKQ